MILLEYKLFYMIHLKYKAIQNIVILAHILQASDVNVLIYIVTI